MIEASFSDSEDSLRWLSKCLDPSRFDIAITDERKATAIFRALLDLSPEIDCDWPWTKVLSSDALRFLPSGWLTGKRILVFTEMIHHGHSTQNTLDSIKANTPSALPNVTTAALAVHQSFRKGGCWKTQDFRRDPDALSPDLAMDRDVTDETYAIYRERFVSYLRSKGALLLDTEHLESTFTFSLPHREFLDALTRLGVPVEYSTGESVYYPGITVEMPAIADNGSIQAMLPLGTEMEGDAPKKVRLVRRGAKEFAFIPIWYPSVPVESVDSPEAWIGAPLYVQRALQECPADTRVELAFHLVGLIASIELIRSTWGALAGFVNKGIEYEALSGSEEAYSPLGHLRSLYPLLEFNELEAAINAAISAHKDAVFSKRILDKAGWSKKHRNKAIVVSREARDVYTRSLLRELVLTERQFSLADDWFEEETDSEKSEVLLPFTWRQMCRAGEQVGIRPEISSIVMDWLIDSAMLKTSYKKVEVNGRAVTVRAFKPDSEFAREAIERLAYGAESLVVLI